MLLDHGSDAIVAGSYSITLTYVFLVGHNWYSLLIVGIGMGMFLFIVFEEHFKGYFYLGKINAASDSSFVFFLLFGFTAGVGNRWWGEGVIDGVNRAQVFFAVVSLVTFCSIFYSLF